MSNEPTPRTDDFLSRNSSYMEKRAYMMELERELTEVTKQRDELKRWTSVNGVIDLQRERDEARAKIELSRRWSAAIADIADNLRSELAAVTEQRDALAEALRLATACPLTEIWYNQAIEALATLKPCD
jgi:hypothetical protein